MATRAGSNPSLGGVSRGRWGPSLPPALLSSVSGHPGLDVLGPRAEPGARAAVGAHHGAGLRLLHPPSVPGSPRSAPP